MLKIITALLFLIVVAAPLPLGGNRDWAWDPLAVVVAFATILQGGYFLTARSGVWHFGRKLALPGCAFVIVCLWAFAQCVIALSGASSDAIFGGVKETLGSADTLRIAIDSDAALEGLVRLLTYGAVFWLAAIACIGGSSAKMLCRVFVATAVGVTLFGLATDLPAHRLVSGTFVNPDNYATYVGLACLVCLLNFQGKLQSLPIHTASTRERWRSRIAVLSGTSALWIAALAILLTGLISSSSRSGLLSLLAAAVVGSVTLSILQRRGRSATIWTIVVLVVAAGGVFLFAGDNVASRFALLVSNSDVDRPALYSMTADAISIHPYTGWGIGSFKDLYAMFQPTFIELDYDKAHNTYLETALEIGIPGAVVFIVAIALIVGRCLIGTRTRSRDSYLPAIGFAATFFIALHALVDFGSQIPATALSYALLLGMAWAQSWSSRLT